jgi:phosphate:Na+ symporter
MVAITQTLTILLPTIGGLGIFMLGMKYMSEGIQTIAGPSLRQMVSRVTDNRFAATATGTTFTLLVQSSSIATVIMVGLVNAGLMKLHQAVGFIMGANIGTTITGWILMLKVGKYGLPIAGIAALVFVFTKRDRLRFIAMAVMGLGLVFLGLELMKQGVEPIREMPQIKEWIQTLKVDHFGGILFCVAVGCLLTFAVQSSSAALGILIAAASTGLVSFPVAAAVILGENIGTTITVVIASLNANRTAKRAAYAHVMFNLIGVSWMVLAFPFTIRLISWAIESIHGTNPITMQYGDFENPLQFGVIMTAAIAAMHTSFNIANTIVFLPFVRQFARLLEWLVPDGKEEEIPHLVHLDAGSVDSPIIGIEQSRREIIQMGNLSNEMMEFVRKIGYESAFDEELAKRALRREDILDNIEREIVAFLTEILQSTVPQAIVEEGRAQLRLAHEFESTCDFLATIVKEFQRLREQKLQFEPERLQELSGLHDAVSKFLSQTVAAYEKKTPIDEATAKQTSKDIVSLISRLREEHLNRVVETSADPRLTMAYTAILTHYRRVRAHILNAQQAISGTKTHPRS